MAAHGASPRRDASAREARAELGARHPRILAFTTLFPSEAVPLHGLFVWERLRALSKRVPLRVLAPVNGLTWLGAGRRFEATPARTRRDGVDIEHPRYFNVPGVLKSLDGTLMARSVADTFARAVSAFEPDIVDIHWGYPDGVAGAVLARRASLPYFITVRGDDVSVFLRTRARRRQMLRALNGARGVIGVCRALIDAAVACGVREDLCHVVPNGVDPEVFHALDRLEARRALGIDADAPLILSVGHLTERKGFHLLVRALARLRSPRGTRARLAIVGGAGEEGDFRKRLEHEIADAGLAERVAMPGPRSPRDLAAWYSAADLFCLASEREGWPNVLLEALACGCPVVATDVWGVAEVIPDGDHGILVERSVASIAAGIDAALERSWDRRALGAYAHSRSWARVAGECLDVYRAALGGE